jgi:hypothetical protein
MGGLLLGAGIAARLRGGIMEAGAKKNDDSAEPYARPTRLLNITGDSP